MKDLFMFIIMIIKQINKVVWFIQLSNQQFLLINQIIVLILHNRLNNFYKYNIEFATTIQMSNREINCGKLINPHFIGVIVFIMVNYVIFVYCYNIALEHSIKIPILIVFHILFLMLLWSMIKSIVGDPGRVPIYWGFFAQQSDNRRRRYCLLCHSFKPQRCHHCSTCQRCVLNMDHHCPWISNCVGFANRKFFMLFLFYVILTLLFCLVVEGILYTGQIISLKQSTSSFSVNTIIRGLGFIVQLAFLIVISTFFKFHVELVLSNSSTLDNLQRQRNPNVGPNVYDVSAYENFTQVFGTNALLWPFPIASNASQKANGVVWPKNQ